MEDGVISLVDVYLLNGITPGADTFLFRLLKERPALVNISHVTFPSPEAHRQFVHSKTYRHWFIIDANGEWVGSIHATHWNAIGVVILEAHQKRGYARQAMLKFMDSYAPLPPIPSVRRGSYTVNIAPQNEGCKTLVKSLGGRLIHLTYEVEK